MGNDRRDTEEETWFRQALRCLRGLGVEGFWVQGLGLLELKAEMDLLSAEPAERMEVGSQTDP